MIVWSNRVSSFFWRQFQYFLIGMLLIRHLCEIHLNHGYFTVFFTYSFFPVRVLDYWYSIFICNIPWVQMWYDREIFRSASVQTTRPLKICKIMTYFRTCITSSNATFAIQAMTLDRICSVIFKSVFFLIWSATEVDFDFFVKSHYLSIPS